MEQIRYHTKMWMIIDYKKNSEQVIIDNMYYWVIVKILNYK